MSDAIQNAINTMAEAWDEEAKDYVQSLNDRPKMTKDNYGDVLGFLGHVPDMGLPEGITQAAFLQAMVNNGYPAATAADIRKFMDLPGPKDSQAILMGLA